MNATIETRGNAVIALSAAALAAMLCVAVALGLRAWAFASASPVTVAKPVAAVSADLPLAFEPNAGRIDGPVDFTASTQAGSVALGRHGATLAQTGGARGGSITIGVAGADLTNPAGIHRLDGMVNDLRGARAGWRTAIPTFAGVRYAEALPGIDLEFHGRTGALEYDFRVAPGADPRRIALDFRGADSLRLSPGGDLIARDGDARFRQAAPVAWQPGPDGRQPVGARFGLDGDRVRFELDSYDPSRRLVIDPVLVDFSTYLGGSGIDQAQDVAVGADGSIYVAGVTNSADFEVVNADRNEPAGFDVFVTKLDPTGTRRVYSTFIGTDSNADSVGGIAVGPDGSAYIGGNTLGNWPLKHSYEPKSASFDNYVTKLSPDGSQLEWSTYLGGNGTEDVGGIAVGAGGAAYITGFTESTDFDRVNAVENDRPASDAYLAKLNLVGGDVRLLYSTYLGGSAEDDANAVALDASGAAYVVGTTRSADYGRVGGYEGHAGGADAFVTKVTPGGSVAYSTYLGGSGDDVGTALALDSGGAAYVAGYTASSDFDRVGGVANYAGSTDAFVTKLAPDGGSLEYSTFLGGAALDLAAGIDVRGGRAYVAGTTLSSDAPRVREFQGYSGDQDAFVFALDPSGSDLELSSPYGGTGVDSARAVAVSPSAGLVVAGLTYAANFPVEKPLDTDAGENERDAFLVRFDLNPETSIVSGPANRAPTNDPTYRFASDRDGVTFECSFEESAFAPCGQTHTFPASADGTYLFEVRAVTATGNYDETTAFRRFVLDRTAPETEIGGEYPAFSLSSEAGATFECRLDHAGFAPCDSPARLDARASGTHTFEARAVDAAGNADPSPAATSFAVGDRPPPAPDCDAERAKLAKAKAKLRKAKRSGSAAKIKRAKSKVKKSRAALAACQAR